MKQNNRIDRLCIVLAHGGAVETVKRHLPIWQANHDQVIVCSPADDPIQLPTIWGFVNGRSSKYAADTNLRAREAMRLATVLQPHTLTVCEYDALLWHWPTAHIATMQPDSVMGSVFQSADPKFKGKFYIHSPIIFGPQAIAKVTEAMEKLPDGAEGGFGDRYFGLAVETAGIPVIDGHAHGLSYSQNHIEAKHLADARRTIGAGAVFTHGVKDAAVLRVLADAAKITY